MPRVSEAYEPLLSEEALAAKVAEEMAEVEEAGHQELADMWTWDNFEEARKPERMTKVEEDKS